MLMHCPLCRLPWSDDGLTPIRGQSYSGRGAPPTEHWTVATSTRTCEECGRSRLPKLLGCEVSDNPVLELAAGLDCSPAHVDEVLRARGDHELLTLLESDTLARR